MLNRRFALYLITWLTDFSIFLILFAVSRELAELEKSAILMGSVGAVMSLASAAASYASGRLSDRTEPRWIMFIGLSLLAMSSLWLIFFHQPMMMLAAYLLAGLSVGMIYPPLVGLLNRGRDSLHDARGQGRVFMNFCLAWNLGMVSGQLTGGWLINVSYPLPLAVAAGLALAAILLVNLYVPLVSALPSVSYQPSPERHDHQSLSSLFAHLAWVANLSGAFSISTLIYLLPRLMVAMKISPQSHGIMLGEMRAVVILTYVMMHHLRFWHHRFSTAAASQVAAIVGMLLIAGAGNERDVLIGMLLVGPLIGYNYFASLYYSTSAADSDARATASGIHEATLALGFAAGSFCGGYAIELLNERAPYLLSAIMILSLLLVQTVMFYLYVRPRVSERRTLDERLSGEFMAVDVED